MNNSPIVSRALVGAVLLLILFHNPCRSQVTERVSVSTSGEEGNGDAWGWPVVSSDGRFVAFSSYASNLVSGDTNGLRDIFVRDRMLGRTTRLSVDSAGTQANGASIDPTISGDGRWVAFFSVATNLVANDTNGFADVFVHDRETGITVLASLSFHGAQGDGASEAPSISLDGRWVAFQSWASNLVPGDTNNFMDVFVRDLVKDVTYWVSHDSASGSGSGINPSISSDGRYVAFSTPHAFAPSDTNGVPDCYVRDMQFGGGFTLISVDSLGAIGNDDSDQPMISTEGTVVAFHSLATNLVPGDTNGGIDVFVHDLLDRSTVRVNVHSDGTEDKTGANYPTISADGRYVAFTSAGDNLVANDTNGDPDVFVHDVVTGRTDRVSIRSNGQEGNKGAAASGSSADGRSVVFYSLSSFAPGDHNHQYDMYVHGPEITLDASQTVAIPGDMLVMTLWRGHVGDPTALFLIAIDQVPRCAPLVFGFFDSAGLWPQSFLVPPSAVGFDFTLQGFAQGWYSGKVQESNPVTLQIQ